MKRDLRRERHTLPIRPARAEVLAALCVPEPDDNIVVSAMRRGAAEELANMLGPR